MKTVRPVRVQPLLDAKPWGGRRLEECGIALPLDDVIGEAHLTAPESIVTSGDYAGTPLGELARRFPETWAGELGLAVTGGRAIFPLLVKLIDANADLSIQVHPDDAAAAAAKLGTGKTEAWHVLAARPGSVLFLGLNPEASGEDFTRACLRCDGSAARYLRQVAATPGATVVVPAGTPHAIGAGTLLYEIQQPSNVTFRLDDWGRLDKFGQRRDLHHDAGFAALDPQSRPEPVQPVVLSRVGPRRELLTATRYFALERIAFAANDSLQRIHSDSPQVLTCTLGEVRLTVEDWSVTLNAGETVIIPVGLPCQLSSPQAGVILRGWVPDLEGEVVAPARAAGAANEAVLQLGVVVGGI